MHDSSNYIFFNVSAWMRLATVRQDLGEVETTNNWDQNERGSSAMADAGLMVTSIKGDGNFRPRVVLPLIGLHGIYLAEGALLACFRGVRWINHVHVLNVVVGWKCTCRGQES